MLENPHCNTPLAVILAQLHSRASQSFESAQPIPPALNHSIEYYHLERDSVFMQEWICVGREDELVSPGCFLTHEVAGVSVLVVRNNRDQLAAYVNACAHRQARLIDDDKGCTKKITCPYHAWSYDLDGQLVRAPYMEMKVDFDISQHGLRRLHLETWEGFVYVSLAENPETSLNQVLAPFKENIVGRFDMSCYQTVMRETMIWGANWKNLIENFTESYHVPMAHRQTFAKHAKPLEDYICGEDSNYYGYHRAVQPSNTGSGAAHVDNHRLEGEWRRMMIDFCVFPCHLVTLMPDFLWYISVQPKGIDQFQATWGVAIPPEVLADIPGHEYDKWLSDLKNYMDVANGEDKVLVEALHQGTKSPILPPGTYHPIERNLWNFVRYLDRRCNQNAD